MTEFFATESAEHTRFANTPITDDYDLVGVEPAGRISEKIVEVGLTHIEVHLWHTRRLRTCLRTRRMLWHWGAVLWGHMEVPHGDGVCMCAPHWSSIHRLPSVVCHPLSSVCHASVVCLPMSAVHHPPSAVCHQQTLDNNRQAKDGGLASSSVVKQR